MYGWAPLAIMGEEINRLSPSSTSHPPRSRSSTDQTTVEMSLMADDDDSLATNMVEDSSSSAAAATFLKSQQPADNLIANSHNDDNDAEDGGMVGIYLGIHNIFATIPQFLATFVSMAVFSILEPGQSPELAAPAPTSGSGVEGSAVKLPSGNERDDRAGSMNGLSGTAVCLAIGAVFQLLAAAQSLRMRRRY